MFKILHYNKTVNQNGMNYKEDDAAHTGCKKKSTQGGEIKISLKKQKYL